MEYALSLKSPIGKYRIFNLLIFEEINWLSHDGKIRVDIAHEVDMSLSDHFCHLSAVYYIYSIEIKGLQFVHVNLLAIAYCLRGLLLAVFLHKIALSFARNECGKFRLNDPAAQV